MEHPLFLYNSLTRKKDQFIPLNPPAVGLYVCGPTVYSEPHLGHVRMAITFDILFRYLMHLGYKVRYIRNITDVGHLEDEVAGTGEDRISKKAKLEQLEPMEVVQKYKLVFQDVLKTLNTLPPSIEPQASGHIIEQQEMIDKIMENGFAYEEEGSVYFDIEAYNKKYKYGKLSGRKVEDMLSNTRNLDGQSGKRNPLDFALWKKASPGHIMQWPSKWSRGFPGWHLECSAMGTKYLGETFDIHGGGMDLLFPHHECEIAQSTAANGKEHVRYWVHNNMITIEGQKMARSLNNFITLAELFSGKHEKLERAYSPMNIRFFILQAHYRSTIDFSNEALQASEKGMQRLFKAMETLENIKAGDNTTVDIESFSKKCYEALNDDLNTPIAMAHLFDAVKIINLLYEGKERILESDLIRLKHFMYSVTRDILGLVPQQELKSSDHEESLVQMIIDLRLQARKNKDFSTSDLIRDKLAEMGILLNDTKEGTTWEMES
ncbi:MAG: cysteine--tRNA ligase [Bacteroidales bacterium]|nr:cysteine--tRNA ligase [Bacteroidales bacterium]